MVKDRSVKGLTQVDYDVARLEASTAGMVVRSQKYNLTEGFHKPP
jgi:hypothetical protein